MAGGGPRHQASRGGPGNGGRDWAARPTRQRVAAANDNPRPPRALSARRRIAQTLLLAAATAAVLILAHAMR